MTNPNETWEVLAEFELPSEPGIERQAIDRVAALVDALNLPKDRLERIKTAVGEATMNASEHGNHFSPEMPVEIQVRASAGELVVQITDFGGDEAIPAQPVPDLDAKLAGFQTPRGWGMLIIQNMVDEMRIHTRASRHSVELVFLRP